MAQAMLQAEHHSPNVFCPAKDLKLLPCNGGATPAATIYLDMHSKGIESGTEMTQPLLLQHHCCSSLLSQQLPNYAPDWTISPGRMVAVGGGETSGDCIG